MENPEEFQSRVKIEQFKQKTQQIRDLAASYIVGKQKEFDLLTVGLLAGGHVLIEGVPGVAKTLSAKLLAKMINTGFSRIQFTPDLMPADVLGTAVFNLKNNDFEFKAGPIFSNLILIDEINRAPAKTQSALFEVMEERQVTIDKQTHPMPPLYMVVATQNPLEHEGTYRLPEAQLDRFIFKINVGYPSSEEEVEILKKHHQNQNFTKLETVQPVVSENEIIDLRTHLDQVHVDENILSYITKIVGETRQNAMIYVGASPRASIDLLRGSKALALLKGRDFVTPEDVQYLAAPVIIHRVILSPEAELEGLTPEEVVNQMIKKIEVPR